MEEDRLNREAKLERLDLKLSAWAGLGLVTAVAAGC